MNSSNDATFWSTASGAGTLPAAKGWAVAPHRGQGLPSSSLAGGLPRTQSDGDKPLPAAACPSRSDTPATACSQQNAQALLPCPAFARASFFKLPAAAHGVGHGGLGRGQGLFFSAFSPVHAGFARPPPHQPSVPRVLSIARTLAWAWLRARLAANLFPAPLPPPPLCGWQPIGPSWPPLSARL